VAKSVGDAVDNGENDMIIADGWLVCVDVWLVGVL
jgi:hypothetical protein